MSQGRRGSEVVRGARRQETPGEAGESPRRVVTFQVLQGSAGQARRVTAGPKARGEGDATERWCGPVPKRAGDRRRG
jgi:hypothetical protein